MSAEIDQLQREAFDLMKRLDEKEQEIAAASEREIAEMEKPLRVLADRLHLMLCDRPHDRSLGCQWVWADGALPDPWRDFSHKRWFDHCASLLQRLGDNGPYPSVADLDAAVTALSELHDKNPVAARMLATRRFVP